MGVEGDPVDDRGDQAGVGEDGAPFAEWQVRPDRDGGAFVPLGDDLEEQLGAAGVDLDIAELVQEEQVKAAVAPTTRDRARWPAASTSSLTRAAVVT